MKRTKIAILGTGLSGCAIISALSKVVENNQQVIIVGNMKELRDIIEEDIPKKFDNPFYRATLTQSIKLDDLIKLEQHQYGGYRKPSNNNRKH